MNARKFILTYRNGKQEEVITDAADCNAQCMRSFGLTLEEAREFGGNVELAEEVNPPPADPGDSGLPQLPEGQTLNSSSVQPAIVKVGGFDVQLGDVVKAAWQKSQLTVEEWNALEDGAREAYIAAEIDVLEQGGEGALEEDKVPSEPSTEEPPVEEPPVEEPPVEEPPAEEPPAEEPAAEEPAAEKTATQSRRSRKS